MGINIRDRHIPVKHTYTPPVFDLAALGRQDGGMNNIASIRRLRGLNQAQLAEKVGVSQPHISRIEKGDEGPPLALFRQVAEALDVTLSDLFAEDRGAAHRYLIEMFDSLPIPRQKAWLAMAELAQKEAALEAAQNVTAAEKK